MGTGCAEPSAYRGGSALHVRLRDGRGLLLDAGEGALGQLVRHYGPAGATKQVCPRCKTCLDAPEPARSIRRCGRLSRSCLCRPRGMTRLKYVPRYRWTLCVLCGFHTSTLTTCWACQASYKPALPAAHPSWSVYRLLAFPYGVLATVMLFLRPMTLSNTMPYYDLGVRCVSEALVVSICLMQRFGAVNDRSVAKLAFQVYPFICHSCDCEVRLAAGGWALGSTEVVGGGATGAAVALPLCALQRIRRSWRPCPAVAYEHDRHACFEPHAPDVNFSSDHSFSCSATA